MSIRGTKQNGVFFFIKINELYKKESFFSTTNMKLARLKLFVGHMGRAFLAVFFAQKGWCEQIEYLLWKSEFIQTPSALWEKIDRDFATGTHKTHKLQLDLTWTLRVTVLNIQCHSSSPAGVTQGRNKRVWLDLTKLFFKQIKEGKKIDMCSIVLGSNEMQET